MEEYRLLTIWRIEAPLEEVYAAIQNSLRWPEWWPSVRAVKQLAAGDAEGVNSVWRYGWQGKLPYQVVFEVCATRVEKLVAIEGVARGDLDGFGRWNFTREGVVSIVRCEWHVRSTLWWMNLLAPIARSLFIRNHARVMAQGGAGLSRLLSAPLVSQQTTDLMAEARPASRWRWLRMRSVPALALVAGIGAGIIATLAQLLLWWLADMPLAETFFQDVRLTAALLMGTGILHPPAAILWSLLLVATLIHFVLSFVYALFPAYLFSNLRTGTALFAGALYGLAIYAINLYGFTLLFPWFIVDRNWVTMVTHLVFGVALAVWCRLVKTSKKGIRLAF